VPESADHGLGRSRGGLTTKVHLACEQGQKPLSIVITAGQRVTAGNTTHPSGPERPRAAAPPEDGGPAGTIRKRSLQVPSVDTTVT
jgi:hypothetical protein